MVPDPIGSESPANADQMAEYPLAGLHSRRIDYIGVELLDAHLCIVL